MTEQHPNQTVSRLQTQEHFVSGSCTQKRTFRFWVWEINLANLEEKGKQGSTKHPVRIMCYGYALPSMGSNTDN